MLSAMRLLRTLHGWMGIIVLPWVLIYGLSGFYLNHERQVNALFGADRVDEYWIENEPGRLPDEEGARQWFAQAFPGLHLEEVVDEPYHGKSAFVLDAGRISVVAPKNSGFYFVKDRYTRRLYDASGALVDMHRYWPTVVKDVHVNGWLRSPAGTLGADMFAGVLVAFGLTGSFLWLAPRILRMRARRHSALRQAS